MASSETWLWQDGTLEGDALNALVVGEDGTITFAGYTQDNVNTSQVVATKLRFLDAAGADGSQRTELWKWHDEWNADPTSKYFYSSSAAVVAADGSTFLTAYVLSFDSYPWTTNSTVTRLDSNGSFVWEWQSNSTGGDALSTAALVGDGSGDIYVAGHTYDGDNRWTDFTAYRLSSAGEEIWHWQGGDYINDRVYGAVSVDEGQAVVLVGRSAVSLLAIKLDSGGKKLWEWRDWSAVGRTNQCNAVAAVGDSSVVLSCTTTSGGDLFDDNEGNEDFAVVMLDSAEGLEIWRWQGGTDEDDSLEAVTVLEDGSIVVGGYTAGGWALPNVGGLDFAAVKLSQEGEVISGWQDGSSGDDEIRALATVADGSNNVIFAGYTGGDWAGSNVGGRDFAAMGAPASYFSGTILVPLYAEESGASRSLVVGFVAASIVLIIGVLWVYGAKSRRPGGARAADVDTIAVSSGAATEEGGVEGGRGPVRVLQARRQGPYARRPGSHPVAHRLVEATAGGDATPVVVPLWQEDDLGHDSTAVAEGYRAPYADAVVVPSISSVGGSGRVWNVVTDAEVVER